MCTVSAAESFNSPFVPLQPFHRVLSTCHRRFAGRRLSDHLALVHVNNEFCRALERGRGEESVFAARNSLSPMMLSMTR